MKRLLQKGRPFFFTSLAQTSLATLCQVFIKQATRVASFKMTDTLVGQMCRLPEEYLQELLSVRPLQALAWNQPLPDAVVIEDPFSSCICARESRLRRRFLHRALSLLAKTERTEVPPFGARDDSYVDILVLVDHLHTLESCSDYDTHAMFHHGGGWSKTVLEAVMNLFPRLDCHDVRTTHRRLCEIERALISYARSLGRTARRFPPPHRLVRRMASSLRDRVTSFLNSEEFKRVPEDLQKSLRCQVCGVITNVVIPALDCVRTRKSIGLCHLSAGAAMYDAALRRHTTLDSIDARALHAFGRREVRKLQERIASTTSGGSAHDSTPLTLMESLKTYQHIADCSMGDKRLKESLFDQRIVDLEVKCCRVKEMPNSEQCDAPKAYYVGDTFNVNPTHWHAASDCEALAFHEVYPGHHFQFKVENHRRTNSDFRYFCHHTGYVEGWAVYSETLVPTAIEGGDAGVLRSQLLRAARVVLDTGVHALGWTGEQALEYMKAVVPGESEASVSNEMDRVISEPGQLCGYYVGKTVVERFVDRKDEPGSSPPSAGQVGRGEGARSRRSDLLLAGSMPLRLIRGWRTLSEDMRAGGSSE